MLIGNGSEAGGQGALVILPMKPLPTAKSRLRGSWGGLTDDLVLAMATDVVAAALGAPAVGTVLVVTDDPRAATALATDGATILEDEPRAGLNEALRWGASRFAGSGRVVVAAMADLPCATADDFDALARRAAHGRCFVPDNSGTGTTCLAAPAPQQLQPAFGAGSSALHATGGATELNSAQWRRLRRDVDTDDDLSEAQRIGLGHATQAWLTARRKPGAP